MSEVMTARDPEIQQLLDKQAIRDAIMRYCRGVDRCDPELISSAYYPDAIDEHGHRTFTGDAVGQGIADWVRPFLRCMHHVTNQTIQIDGDAAGCESYYAVWQLEEHEGEERVLQALGRYVDRFERRDGEWKIAHRIVVGEIVRYLPPESFPVDAITDRGRRDHTDPSYAVLGDRPAR